MDLIKLCEKKIQPKTDKIDHDRAALKKAFLRLGKNKLLALRAPKQYGGLEYSHSEYFQFVETLESYSGALGFFQRQHQCAARLIAQDGSDQLKAAWLPPMAKGKRTVGVCLSHLHHLRALSIVGKGVEGGFELEGQVSWVSGYKIFDYLVVGFFLPEEEEEAFALIRFKKSRVLKVSKPHSTVALSSMQTVSLHFKRLFVRSEMVFSVKSFGSYKSHTSQLGVHFVNLSGIALGFKRELEGIDSDLYFRLSQEYNECRTAFLERERDESLPDLYVRMFQIATDFCQLALYKAGTKSIIRPNAVERRYRELMVFSVIAGPISAHSSL